MTSLSGSSLCFRGVAISSSEYFPRDVKLTSKEQDKELLDALAVIAAEPKSVSSAHGSATYRKGDLILKMFPRPEGLHVACSIPDVGGPEQLVEVFWTSGTTSKDIQKDLFSLRDSVSHKIYRKPPVYQNLPDPVSFVMGFIRNW